MGGTSSQQVQEVLSPHSHGSNRITELQFLTSDDINSEQRFLVRIDDDRIASANDKGQIRIWNYHKGSLLFKLQHAATPTISEPKISNLLVMKVQKTENPTLVAAFGDIITFWDTTTGRILEQIVDKNQTQITYLCPLLQPELFAVGGDKSFVPSISHS